MKSSRAFTLIELLVVISIIGVLSSVVLANLSSVRSKARDTQRRLTLKQYQSAMEMYASNNQGNYPAATGYFTNNGFAVVFAPSYISTVTDDPLISSSGKSYIHQRKDAVGGTINTTNCPSLILDSTKWAIYAKLENPSPSEVNMLSQGDSYDQCVNTTLGPSGIVSPAGYNYKVGN